MHGNVAVGYCSKLLDEKSGLAKTEKILTAEIAELNKEISTIEDTMNRINDKLRDSGFQGFTLHKKAGTSGKYEIIRDDGTPAKGLSEGGAAFHSVPVLLLQSERQGVCGQRVQRQDCGH